jgi:hypothetical protein
MFPAPPASTRRTWAPAAGACPGRGSGLGQNQFPEILGIRADAMTAIVLAAAGGVTCAAGIALYAGLKARRQAPVVTWRAWAEGFPVRAVSWGLAVAVTLAVLAGAAAAIDARVTGQGPPRAPRGDAALPQHLSLPAITPGSARRSYHRRRGAQPGSPAASTPTPMVYPAPTLPVPGSHPPVPTPTVTQTPTPTPTPSPTPSLSPSPTPSLSPSPTPSLSPTPTPSLSPTPTPTPTVVPSPTATATPSSYGENR